MLFKIKEKFTGKLIEEKIRDGRRLDGEQRCVIFCLKCQYNFLSNYLHVTYHFSLQMLFRLNNRDFAATFQEFLLIALNFNVSSIAIS